MLLHEKLLPYRLLLASQSPRRRELLTGCGLRYELAPRYDVEETYPADMAAADVPLYLSQLKSDGFPRPLAEGEILLTADTVVIAGGEILGKPHDRADALRMLRKLSGARHTVITGVTLRTADRRRSFTAASEVTLRTLTDEETAYYVDTFRPYDKAGSYGIQEWIGYAAIERIDGSFYNVMGLPVQRVYVELERFIGELSQQN
ncbi:MAG: Maf family nucleotide pyrophosphatase [Alistipes sp.]|nr:Maf family nucleotide pyrophosphatase [Alistipes sp.]